jgi:hypothetical protein
VAEQGHPTDPRGRHRLFCRDTNAGSLLPVRCLIQSTKVHVVRSRNSVRYSPFPRSAIAGDDALESDEMLAMLYSMAIMR